MITSGHNEDMGEDGFFSHGKLSMETVHVSLFVLAAHWPKHEVIPDIHCVENHFKVDVLILAALGYKFEDPNENDNTYFVNGNDLYGDNGFIEYKLPGCNPFEHAIIVQK